ELTARQRAVQQYLDVLAAARGAGPVDAIRWGSALARVSRLTEIPVDQLNRRFAAKPTAGPRRPMEVADKSRSEPAEWPADRRPLSSEQRAERWILGVLLAEPGRWHHVQQHVEPADFTSENARAVAELY